MRKLACGSIVLVLVTFGWGHRGVGQQVPAPRGELRIVDKHPDNWAWITFNVFEHLIEADKDGKLVPGLATHWQWLDERTLEVQLRHGVKFHNGEVLDAEIVQLNWDEITRLRQAHSAGEFLTRLGGLLPTNAREAERGKREGPVPNNARGVSESDSALLAVQWVSRTSAHARRAILPRVARSPVWPSRRSI